MHFFKPFPGITGCFMGKNTESLRKQEWDLEDLFLLRQVHSDRVITLKKIGDETSQEEQEADGVLSHLAEIPIAVKTADCVPILFAHPSGLIGAVHAGWRGSSEQILAKAIQKAERDFQARASEIQMAIGPAICWDHYEVGREVARLFPEGPYPGVLKPFGEKYLLNLTRVNYLQALAAGVLEKNLQIFSQCTFENSDWHSYRRTLKEGGQETGRNYSWIVFR